jgi:hypothetical protein
MYMDGNVMSGEGAFGLALAEKFFGLILIIVGALAAYFTFTNSSALNAFTGFFGFLSVLLLALGVFLLIVKTE